MQILSNNLVLDWVKEESHMNIFVTEETRMNGLETNFFLRIRAKGE
jgi:hypothetical protein